MAIDTISVPLRMPVQLRERASNAAAIHGVSINREMVARLQESFSGSAIDGVLDLLEIPSVMRIKSGVSAASDVGLFGFFLSRFDITRIFLGAQSDDFGGLYLMAVFVTSGPTLIMDGSKLSFQTPRRQHEVADIFVSLRGHRSVTYYFTQSMPSTKSLAPDEALRSIFSCSKPLPLVDIHDFLRVLASSSSYARDIFWKVESSLASDLQDKSEAIKEEVGSFTSLLETKIAGKHESKKRRGRPPKKEQPQHG